MSILHYPRVNIKNIPSGISPRRFACQNNQENCIKTASVCFNCAYAIQNRKQFFKEARKWNPEI